MSRGELPGGWESAPLNDFCLIVQGQSPPGDTYNTSREGLPFFQGKAEFGEIHPTPVKWCSAPAKVAEADDVLISIRAPVGPTNLCATVSCIGRGLAAVRPRAGISPMYVLYGLRASVESLAAQATGTTFAAIGGDVLRAHRLPLAPLPEQHRIVAEIDKQFTRLDAGVAALERVRTNLKRYRAAVLKAAVEGRLVPTEAELARAEGRDYRVAEPPLGVTDRLEPESSTGLRLPTLPQGWRYAALGGLLAEPLVNGRSVPDAATGVPVLRLTAIRENGIVDLRQRKVGAWTAEEASNYLVRTGDFFVSRGNGSKRLVGRGALVETVPDAVAYPDLLISVRPDQRVVAPGFLKAVWNSPVMRGQIESVARTTAGIYKINQQDMSRFILPVPSLMEQQRIVAEVERRLSLTEELETTVNACVKRAARLRQAILKRAFEGKLVPQDPDDEPAPVLLERIRSERDGGAAPPRAATVGTAIQPVLFHASR